MREVGFEFEDHTADVQARCWGSTLEEAYEQTAYSLMNTISPGLKNVDLSTKKEFTIKAEDKEAILFDFLSEFLYIFDVEGLIFKNIKVYPIITQDDSLILKCEAWGERFDPDKHEIGTEVKAITYSFLTIEKSKEKVEIRIVFDI